MLDGLLKEIPQGTSGPADEPVSEEEGRPVGGSRWETVRQYEAAGQRLEAMMLRDRIKMEVREADQARRYQAEL